VFGAGGVYGVALGFATLAAVFDGDGPLAGFVVADAVLVSAFDLWSCWLQASGSARSIYR
jgi:hypothetical protein